MLKSALSALFGANNNSGIHLDIRVKGFDVGLSTGPKEGEYSILVRANGNNPDFPEEEKAKIVHFTKSESQFNLSIPRHISARHDYSRIVLDVVAPGGVREKNFILVELNNPKPELCLMAYIRDENGKEKLWGGMGIECLLPPSDEREVSPEPRKDTPELIVA